MKTAMQQLMESFDDYQLESQEDSITIEKLKEVITNQYLKIEKRQLLDFNDRGFEVGRKNISETANDYYEDVFKIIVPTN